MRRRCRDGISAAHTEMKNILHDQPDYAEGLCLLTLIDPALGRRQEAIAGRRAADPLPSKRFYDEPGTTVKPRNHLRRDWRKRSRHQAARIDATALRTDFLGSTAFTPVVGSSVRCSSVRKDCGGIEEAGHIELAFW